MTDEEKALIIEIREGGRRMLAESEARTKTLNTIREIVKGVEEDLVLLRQRVLTLEKKVEKLEGIPYSVFWEGS